MKLAIMLCAPAFVAAVSLGPTPTRATPAVADAAMRGDVATVRKLIAQRADVNVAQGDGMTALHWAAEHGDVAMTEALLKAHAKVGVVTRIAGYTPLHIASKSGSGAVVTALLNGGSDANVATTSGATALHFAAAAGNVEAVTALIDHHADLNAKESEWGQTPLMFAAAADRGAAIRVLLKRGADASVRTKMINLTEQAAQDQAANRKRAEVLLSMLPATVRDSIKAATAASAAAAASAAPGGGALPGIPPVPGAAAPAQADAAPARQGGAGGQGGGGRGGPQIPMDKLTSAQIQEAIVAGRTVLTTPPTVKAADDDTTDGQVAGYAGTVGNMGGLTALHHAVRQGNLDAVVALVDGGADINQPSAGDGTTPLLHATINGQFDVAMKLVERGANVNLLSTAGTSPLYATINAAWLPRSRFPQPQAVQNQKTSHIELMKALLKAGADPNARLKQNLWYFAYNNCGNANCGLENLEGTTPFWRAAYAVDVEAMRVLVAAGADPTTPSLRAPPTAGGRGGRGGRGGGAARGGRGGGGAAAADSTQVAAAPQRGAFGGGGGRGGPQGPPLDPATDSASKAVPPGIGVYPIHDAAGVGYGNGYAGNSHRHAPDGWMPAMKYLVEELHADVNQRDLNGYTPLHHAAARGDNEMILYLVAHGADVKAVSRRGQTVADMANGPVSRISPLPETIALLEKLGSKNSHRCASC